MSFDEYGDNMKFEFRPEPFWPDLPVSWFLKIEAQFSLHSIETDITKFNYIVSLLDKDTVVEVEETIRNPPDGDMYETLKNEIIERVVAKNENKVRERLMSEEMGNRKPSQYLRYLKHVAGKNVREDLVQSIWLSMLPSKMQPIVSCLSSLPTKTLTEVADQLYEVIQPSNEKAVDPSSLKTLLKQAEELNRKIEIAKAEEQTKSNEINVAKVEAKEVKENGGSVKKLNNLKKQTVPCRYHTKYGVKFCKLRSGM